MSKIFVSTFGFTEATVLTPIVKIGLSREDRIVVLTAKVSTSDNRLSNALKKLEEMVKYISGNSITLEVMEIPVENFTIATNIIRKFLKQIASQGKVYVNLSGGMRALILEAYTASLLVMFEGVKISFTDLELEGSTGTVKLVPLYFPLGLKKTELQILRELSKVKGIVSMSELSKTVGLSLSTISRTLHSLSSRDFVKLKKKGRRVLVEVAEQVRMLE